MIRSVSFKNYKSFKGKTTINIKPVTILVGPNSSGKSSILRLFALLKQSLDNNQGSFLRYDGPLYDSKDFKSISHQRQGERVEVSFMSNRYEYESYNKVFLIDESRVYCVRLLFDDKYSHVQVRLDNNRKTEAHFQKWGFSLFEGQRLQIRNEIKKGKYGKLLKELDRDVFTDRRIDECLFKIFDLIPVGIKVRGFCPSEIDYVGSDLSYHSLSKLNICKELSLDEPDWENVPFKQEAFVVEQRGVTKEYFLSILDADKKKKTMLTKELDENYKISIDRKLKKNWDAMTSSGISMTDPYKTAVVENIWWRILKQVIDVAKPLGEGKRGEALNKDIRKIYDSVVQSFERVSILPSQRPVPLKYYTKKQISERLMIDSRILYGKSSIPEGWLQGINSDLQLLGVDYEFVVEPMHNVDDLYNVCLIDKANQLKLSIDDVGFGFSQILPILAAKNAPFSYSPDQRLIILEQPEIHLHPKAQSFLANVLADYEEKSPITSLSRDVDQYISKRIHYLIETHSEHLVRGFQVEVAKGNLSKDDIAIYYVGKYKNGNSYVKLLPLDEKGQFTEPWPEGFFDQGYKQALELMAAQR